MALQLSCRSSFGQHDLGFPAQWLSQASQVDRMRIQILHILYPRYSTNSKTMRMLRMPPPSPAGCLKNPEISVRSAPTPLNHALRNPYRLGFNHPEKCTAPSNSFLDLSFGRFNMHLRLKSEASFRLQCSMQEHTTGYQQICTCEIPHLPRVAVN